MSETNAARAAEIARSIRVYRDRLRGIDEDKVAAAIAAALDAAEARGRRATAKAAAIIVTEHYQSLCTEHRLLLVNRSTAILERLAPEDCPNGD